MSTVDVRGDFSHRQRAGGSVTAENVDIVADEADGSRSRPRKVGADGKVYKTVPREQSNVPIASIVE